MVNMGDTTSPWLTITLHTMQTLSQSENGNGRLDHYEIPRLPITSRRFYFVPKHMVRSFVPQKTQTIPRKCVPQTKQPSACAKQGKAMFSRGTGTITSMSWAWRRSSLELLRSLISWRPWQQTW